MSGGPTTYIPPWMSDTQGKDGWEWRMVWLLRNEAGQCAINAAKAEDFRLRALWIARERLFDDIANRIVVKLPEIVV